MNQQQYIIRRKLNMVELAEQLGNISEARGRLGVSRRHFYDIIPIMIRFLEFLGSNLREIDIFRLNKTVRIATLF